MGGPRARGDQPGHFPGNHRHHQYRKDTSGLGEADAIVIELGREIFGARKVSAATFTRALRQFDRRGLVNLVALMGNYAGTAALLTAFDMQLDPGQSPPLSTL